MVYSGKHGIVSAVYYIADEMKIKYRNIRWQSLLWKRQILVLKYLINQGQGTRTVDHL